MFRASVPAAKAINRVPNVWTSHKYGRENCRFWSFKW